MNIALAGIVILIIFLPGILFNKSYFSGEFSNEYTVQDFFGLLSNTLLPTLIIYIIIGIPVSFIFGYSYDFETLLGLLSSNKDVIEKSIENIENFRIEIIIFNSFLNIIAFIIGFQLKNLVVNKNLDTRFPFLRFNNVWHYLLTAKFILLRRSQIQLVEDTIQDADITYIVALTNVGNKSILYNGILVDYELSKDGSLNLIYLKGAKRREIDENEDSYVDIEGHIIILKYENIINLNISFIATDIIRNDENEIVAVETRLIE